MFKDKIGRLSLAQSAVIDYGDWLCIQSGQ